MKFSKLSNSERSIKGQAQEEIAKTLKTALEISALYYLHSHTKILLFNHTSSHTS